MTTQCVCAKRKPALLQMTCGLYQRTWGLTPLVPFWPKVLTMGQPLGTKWKSSPSPSSRHLTGAMRVCFLFNFMKHLWQKKDKIFHLYVNFLYLHGHFCCSVLAPCHAILAGNVSSELSYLDNIQDNLQPSSVPILSQLLHL